MITILKYRVVAFALAAVFAVFNIGIPVLVASCPMASMMQGGACPMCDDQGSSPTSKVSTEQNASCCATTIVAERNTNEFVQAQSKSFDLASHFTLLPTIFSAINNPSSVSTFAQISASPPTVVDIPILISSLLI